MPACQVPACSGGTFDLPAFAPVGVSDDGASLCGRPVGGGGVVVEVAPDHCQLVGRHPLRVAGSRIGENLQIAQPGILGEHGPRHGRGEQRDVDR